MKSHYKIALFAAVVFFAVVGGYMLTKGGGESSTDTGTTTANSTGTDKPSSASNSTMPKPGSIPPTVINTNSNANTSKTRDLNSLVAEQLAELNKSSSKPVTTTSSTPSSTSSVNTLSSTSTTKPVPTPNPKPVIQTFDGTPVENILTPKPAVTTSTTPVTNTSTVTPPVVVTPTPKPTPAVRTTSYPTNYTILSGDTLSSIALTLYGSERYWVEIAQANPTIDPVKLKPGQVIKLPQPDDMRKTGPQRATRSANGKGTQYTVRAGDNLSTIAQEFYNNSNLWRRIYNANKAAIGSNPDTLQAGVTLDIPPVEPGTDN